jgi:hypothetical protein
MANHQLEIAQPRPYFAELPYYLWPSVGYDSEGDCKSPTDCNWTWLYLCHDDTGEEVEISRGCQRTIYTGPDVKTSRIDYFNSDEHLRSVTDDTAWCVIGPDPTAARAAYFLMHRSSAKPISKSPAKQLGDWDHEQALNRADRVRREFQRPELKPFAVGHLFWGGWKYIGWHGSTFTWGERWIMDSVVRGDTRAVYLCSHWLRRGTYSEGQSEMIRYALTRLTGRMFNTDREWTNWYFDGPGKAEFPQPDFDAWYADMKRIHGDT